MTDTLAEYVKDWDLAGMPSRRGHSFSELHEQILFYQERFYHEYVPTLGSDAVTDFESRLEAWIANLPQEADKQTLLELVPDIVFFSRDDFLKLHQAALRGPVTRWIIDELRVDFCDPRLSDTLHDEIHKHTWFCAVSDSMQMSEFCHANQLGGIQYRPDLRTLSAFGDLRNVTAYMQTRVTPHCTTPDRTDHSGQPVPLKRVVILEDFIGSGAQLEDAKPMIDGLLGAHVPVLLAPLILCPGGRDRIQRLWARSPGFTVEPVLQLSEELFISRNSTPPTASLPAAVKDLVTRVHTTVCGAGHDAYGPFGFADTGSTVVLYSNTPANTLPIIQHQSDTWNALFPRSARVR